MIASQELLSATLFKQVPEGFVYRKPKLWPPAEFYLLNEVQRDAILDVLITRKPWQLVVVLTLVLSALIAVPTAVMFAWAPVMDQPNIVVAAFGCSVVAILVALYLNVRRIQHRVEPILATAKRTDQSFTSADLRRSISKVGSFKQAWWPAVTFGALSLFLLAMFVWDRNYAHVTSTSYVALLNIVLFATLAAFNMRTAYEKIGNAPPSASTSLFVTRPRTLTWSVVAVWLVAFVTISVIGARYEFSDITKGLRLQAAGDTRGAIVSFTKALVVSPQSSTAYLSRAAAYKVVGNLDASLADLTKAIELEPSRPQTYRDRASILSNKKDFARAIVDYGKAIELEPGEVQPYRDRASAYSDNKEWARAIADYDKAISIDPNHAYTYLFRGNVHNSNKDRDRAIADFTKVLEINPQNLYAYLQRGWVYQAKADHERAIADFDRAISIAPKDITPVIARGVSLEARKDYAGAVASFSDAVSIDPNSSRAYYYRAGVHYAVKSVELALADYQTLLNLPTLNDTDRNYHSMAKSRILLLTNPSAVPLTDPK